MPEPTFHEARCINCNELYITRSTEPDICGRCKAAFKRAAASPHPDVLPETERVG